MMAAGGRRYDLARFGMEVFRASPRQADLMIVAGRVSQKMAPVLRQIYDQMPEPKWVLVDGRLRLAAAACSTTTRSCRASTTSCRSTCTCPGCPPRPEMLIDAILKLHEKIQHDEARRATATREVAELEARGASRRTADHRT